MRMESTGSEEKREATGGTVPPRFVQWVSLWKREARRHLPSEFVPDGVIGGGQGCPFPTFALLLLLALVPIVLVSAFLAHMFGWPAAIPVLIGAISTLLLPQALAELGVYRSVLLAWDAERVIIMERAGFDRLVSMRAYMRPLAGGCRFEGRCTILFGEERIHLHGASAARLYLAHALHDSVPAPASPDDGAASFENITHTSLVPGIWHALHVAGIFLLIISLGLPALTGVGRVGVPPEWELPLSSPTAVVANSKGMMAVLLRAYGRVQIYDGAGRFVRGFGTRSFGGPAFLSIDDTDHLWVYASPTLTMRRYLFDGSAAGHWIYTNSSAFRRARLGHEDKPYLDRSARPVLADVAYPVPHGDLIVTAGRPSADFVASDGTRYRAPWPFWLPAIGRSGGGQESLTLWGPWWLLPIAFPTPGIPLGILLFLVGYIGSHPRRTSAARPAAPVSRP